MAENQESCKPFEIGWKVFFLILLLWTSLVFSVTIIIIKILNLPKIENYNDYRFEEVKDDLKKARKNKR